MKNSAGDDVETLKQKLKRRLGADLLIITGGTSCGDHDLVQAALSQLGFSRVFWTVAMKPGKSVLFGTIGSMPVFGLPGNPVATATVFELFVRPALRRLAGVRHPLAPRIKARLGTAVGGNGNREQFLWGRLEVVYGDLFFHPPRRENKKQLQDLPGAHALLPLPRNNPGIAAGSGVEIILLRSSAGLTFNRTD